MTTTQDTAELPPVVKCTRCDRPLTDPKSRQRGRGPVCERKHRAAIEAATKLTSPSMVGRALALVANGGVVQNAQDSFYTVTTEGGSYRTDRALCTCLAGQNGRTCYHLLAVCLVEAKAVRLPA
jgi:hypothetical protein